MEQRGKGKELFSWSQSGLGVLKLKSDPKRGLEEKVGHGFLNISVCYSESEFLTLRVK